MSFADECERRRYVAGLRGEPRRRVARVARAVPHEHEPELAVTARESRARSDDDEDQELEELDGFLFPEWEE